VFACAFVDRGRCHAGQGIGIRATTTISCLQAVLLQSLHLCRLEEAASAVTQARPFKCGEVEP
jgi:hypothetical protein